MRLALAQINVTVGDIAGNQKKILEYAHKAYALEADIVVFPELSLTGYPPEDLLYKEQFVLDNLLVTSEIVQKMPPLVSVVGFVDRNKKGLLYNAAAVMASKKIQGICRKHDLPNYSVFDEKRYFTSGENLDVFSLKGHLIGINICEDIWKDDGLSCQQAHAGTQLLINISSSPYFAQKVKLREAMLKKRAKQTHNFIAYVNLVGGQDELVFDGASFIFSPEGKLLARATQFKEELLVCDIDLSKGIKRKSLKGKKNFVVLELSGGLKEKTKESSKNVIAPLLDPIAEIYQALVLGTRDYVDKNGFKKAVIGLSGGIDSALVAVIAVEALGKDNVVGVSMPSRFSSKETQRDAKDLAKRLGITFLEIPIESTFSSFLNLLEETFQGLKPDITEENLQARIRGNILMALSNKFGWLVLTTGNKSELAVGYCTLYGDMAGGFAVIKDLLKESVYKLAKFCNQSEAQPFIPQSIINRAPSAELRENQKDQDSLPPYEKLDAILASYVERHQSIHKMKQKFKDHACIEKVVRMVDRSEYKRRQAPPGIKITPLAFGKDWRLPITNQYKEHLSKSNDGI